MKKIAVLLSFVVLAAIGMAQAVKLPKTKSAEGARVYIIAPADGEIVPAEFKVQFGLQGMGVAPAGIKFENSGHHHLLVDSPMIPDLDVPLPASETCLHFGKGQTETTLNLKPGKHTLQLVFADHLHLAHDPPLISESITVHIKE